MFSNRNLCCTTLTTQGDKNGCFFNDHPIVGRLSWNHCNSTRHNLGTRPQTLFLFFWYRREETTRFRMSSNKSSWMDHHGYRGILSHQELGNLLIPQRYHAKYSGTQCAGILFFLSSKNYSFRYRVPRPAPIFSINLRATRRGNACFKVAIGIVSLSSLLISETLSVPVRNDW